MKKNDTSAIVHLSIETHVGDNVKYDTIEFSPLVDSVSFSKKGTATIKTTQVIGEKHQVVKIGVALLKILAAGENIKIRR